jgi:hypothetical protein
MRNQLRTITPTMKDGHRERSVFERVTGMTVRKPCRSRRTHVFQSEDDHDLEPVRF